MVVTEKSSVRETARHAKTILGSWYIFLPKMLFEIIVKCTFVYIKKISSNFTREWDASDINITEIKAIIGLLYMIDNIIIVLYFVISIIRFLYI